MKVLNLCKWTAHSLTIAEPCLPFILRDNLCDMLVQENRGDVTALDVQNYLCTHSACQAQRAGLTGKDLSQSKLILWERRTLELAVYAHKVTFTVTCQIECRGWPCLLKVPEGIGLALLRQMCNQDCRAWTDISTCSETFRLQPPYSRKLSLQINNNDLAFQEAPAIVHSSLVNRLSVLATAPGQPTFNNEHGKSYIHHI